MSKYFPVYEYECNCGCGESNMSNDFLLKLDEAREIAGIPFIISSGCRCEKHNRVEGGSKTSSHLSSETHSSCAVDIVTASSHARYVILSSLIKVGLTRIGIAKSFIHVDDDISKTSKLTWTY